MLVLNDKCNTAASIRTSSPVGSILDMVRQNLSFTKSYLYHTCKGTILVYVSFRHDPCQNRNKLWQHAFAAQFFLNFPTIYFKLFFFLKFQTITFEIEVAPSCLGHGRGKIY